MYDLVRGLGVLFWLTYLRVCLLLESCWRFQGCIFSYVTIECWVVNPVVDGFPSFSCYLFAVLTHTFKWEMVAWGGCWIQCGHNLHWLHDCCVLSLYFLGICWIQQCMIDCKFVQDRTICRLYSVWGVKEFCLQDAQVWILECWCL